jgi:stage V sporulation protein G
VYYIRANKLIGRKFMRISDVRVRLVQKEDVKLKAIASITIDECFVIHDIKVIEGTEGYFIAMPSRKTNDGEYKDIAHPINTETRQAVIDAVINAFKDELAKV